MGRAVPGSHSGGAGPLLIFQETELKGAFRIEREELRDERGFFARVWCQQEFVAHGLNPNLAQCSISFNRKKGTLRGMHHQVAPHEEAKLVLCTSGAVHDVIIDLRPESATFKRHYVTVLSYANRQMLYIPERFAHGFQTLEDDTEVLYLISDFYAPECARGVRWDDPAFGIVWPPGECIISERDRTYPDFRG
jgi:dTDP-4-dehydrorhamnose 3,5-epimerase